jgi:hypothetical protein
MREDGWVAMSHLAAASAGHGLGHDLASMAICAGFIISGCIFAFDIFGVATKSSKNNADVAPWGRWVRENWNPPNTLVFVGWGFIIFAGISFIISGIHVIIDVR